MELRRFILSLLLILSLVGLAACDSAEQRAEKHYQSALKLLQEGDEERAIVEFRNVFQLNGRHREARTAYANLQRQRGNIREAIGQYLRLVEQYPDDLNGQRSIAELYAQLGNWREMASFLEAAEKLDPNDKVVRALRIILDYRTALEKKDDSKAAKAVTAAKSLLGDLPDYVMLRQVVIDDDIRAGKLASALKELDAAIERAPKEKKLYAVKLSVLSSLGDDAEVEALLKRMIDLFPEDKSLRTSLVRWFVSQNRLDEAEDYLRQAVQADGADSRQAELTLVDFLKSLKGPQAALDELNKVIDADGQKDPEFIAIRAGIKFEMGNRDEAILELQDLLKGLQPSDDTRKIKVGLAQMLIQTGNSVGARSLVEEVLSEDKTQVDALKLKARWLIEDDKVNEAIVALRTALDQAPRDPEIMTLMAQAHERNGDDELVGEMLSLAVEASNRAPEESLRYAGYLIARNKLDPAETVLINALRLSPDNVQLLNMLGDIYIQKADWPRAEQVIGALRGLQDETATSMADAMQARMLQAQNRVDEAIKFMQDLVRSGKGGDQANIAIVRTYLANGQAEKAESFVNDLLAKNPDDIAVQFMSAAVEAAIGNLDVAEKKYREILKRDDQNVEVWSSLYKLLAAQGRDSEARALIDKAEKALPGDPTLQWIRAGILEKDGDIAGAIAIYESMYAKDSNNPIIANNLASLLTTLKTDQETVDRAYRIARRLRNSDFAPYQDTYGWVALLRGDAEEALKMLEPAAQQLTGDPMVQYHLAKAYAAAKENAKAAKQFQHVLDMVPADDSRPFVKDSRSELERLRKAVETDGNN